MQVKYLLPTEEVSVPPFTSIALVEPALLKNTYVVVRDQVRFHGVLTQSDVLSRGHQLVIDCLTPKKSIRETDEVDKVIDLMLEEAQSVFPVFDHLDQYVGSVTYLGLIKRIRGRCKTRFKKKPEVPSDPERARQTFLKELYHNTKNPIQVIYSSLNLLKEIRECGDNSLLLESIERSTRQIDSVINQLSQTYSET